MKLRSAYQVPDCEVSFTKRKVQPTLVLRTSGNGRRLCEAHGIRYAVYKAVPRVRPLLKTLSIRYKRVWAIPILLSIRYSKVWVLFHLPAYGRRCSLSPIVLWLRKSHIKKVRRAFRLRSVKKVPKILGEAPRHHLTTPLTSSCGVRGEAGGEPEHAASRLLEISTLRLEEYDGHDDMSWVLLNAIGGGGGAGSSGETV